MEIKGQIWILYHAVLKKQTKPISTVQMQKLLLSLKLREINEFFIWTPGWIEWQSLINFMKSTQTFFVLSAIPAPPQKQTVDDIPMVDLLDQHTRSKIVDIEIFNDNETKEMFVEFEGNENFTVVDTAQVIQEKKDEYGYFAGDFKAEDIDVNATPALKDNSEGTQDAERRSKTRHNFRLEVVLISKGAKTFKTFSKNISMGGTLLEDPVPKDFLNGEIEMIITNHFEADKNKARLHFRSKIVGDIRNPQRLTFQQTNDLMMKKLEAMLTAYIGHQKEMIKNRKVK